MSENSLNKTDEIKNLIYTVRGFQVMLDKDLALLYNVKPIRLREQVKRNIKRFPPDFMFQLIDEEVELMVSQNAIPSKQHLGGYPTIEIKEFNNAHDRFIIIDKNSVYHFGASLKDLGKKWFAFSKMDIGAAEMLQKIKNV